MGGFDHINHAIGRRYGLQDVARKRTGSRPTTKFLNDFYAYLVQRRLDDRMEKSYKRCISVLNNNNKGSDNDVKHRLDWIEKLLQTGIDDNRKNLLFWVLAPYLITIRKLDCDKATNILDAWLDKCDDVRGLEPSRSAFDNRVRYCLEAAESQERKPIRFETFKEYYPDIYKEVLLLSSSSLPTSQTSPSKDYDDSGGE